MSLHSIQEKANHKQENIELNGNRYFRGKNKAGKGEEEQ